MTSSDLFFCSPWLRGGRYFFNLFPGNTDSGLCVSRSHRHTQSQWKLPETARPPLVGTEQLEHSCRISALLEGALPPHSSPDCLTDLDF